MAVTDSIADALAAIKNANFAGKDVVEIKSSRLAEGILKILKRENFIANYKLIQDSRQGLLRVYLRYAKGGEPAILGLRKISKPGLRVYKGADELPRVYGGLGVAIVTTSKGLLTDKEAREKKLGGEVLCYVW